MANIGTFGDEFPGTSLSGSWTAFNSPTVTVSGGLLSLAPSSGTPLRGIATVGTFTWQGSKLRGRFNAADVGGGTLAGCWTGPYAGSNNSTVVFFVGTAFSNQVALWRGSTASGYDSGPIATSASGHVWWELDFTGSDMVFRSSADGTSWTDRHTATGTNGSAYNGMGLCCLASDSIETTKVDAIIATESAGGRFRPYFITG